MTRTGRRRGGPIEAGALAVLTVPGSPVFLTVLTALVVVVFIRSL